MAFTDTQRKSLSAKLKHRFVKTRTVHGTKLSYVEGWHVIAEANRIFGYDNWDRRTLSPRCVWVERQEGSQTAALYSTTVRIIVRAGGELVMREGIGTGFGRAWSPEAAHEIALKAAETDATKRALATFGNPFGLALYDKEQLGVTRAPRPTLKTSVASVKTAVGERTLEREPDFALVLRALDGTEANFGSAHAFVDAVGSAVAETTDLKSLYAFWEANRNAFKTLKTMTPNGERWVETVITSLRARARAVGASTLPAPSQISAPPNSLNGLAFPKEKRLRNKAHLRFVAQQPCLVCGRQPCHAHHVRFAQQGALGMKVSDEFTVPLCSAHHDAVHRIGNERSWWVAQGIDPLSVAAQLWRTTLHGGLTTSEFSRIECAGDTDIPSSVTKE